jgi:hypothetical protein
VALKATSSRSGRTAPLVVRGTMLEVTTRTPVHGFVTLWRKMQSGRWKPVLAGRATAPDGSVDLVLARAGRPIVTGR